jgi:hypothetical protein
MPIALASIAHPERGVEAAQQASVARRLRVRLDEMADRRQHDLGCER